jgi:hypothetical protein
MPPDLPRKPPSASLPPPLKRGLWHWLRLSKAPFHVTAREHSERLPERSRLSSTPPSSVLHRLCLSLRPRAPCPHFSTGQRDSLSGELSTEFLGTSAPQCFLSENPQGRTAFARKRYARRLPPAVNAAAKTQIRRKATRKGQAPSHLLWESKESKYSLGSQNLIFL